MKVYEIVEATKGKLLSGDKEVDITGFIQDSRKVTFGDMYIPIIGERLDGHDFIDAAFKNGAIAIITSKVVNYPNKIVIQVKDTTIALQQMAKYLRMHRNIKVVGITGSVGKTSTKDMIYSVVSKKYKALKTLGNYNNEIGLPLTVLRHLDEEVLILEMGMNHLREIALLSDLAMPDIGVITNVGTAHIGELGSRENILKAKLEIVEGMPKDGLLVVNQDNDLLANLTIGNLDIKSVGISNSNYQATNVVLEKEHSTFSVNVDGKNHDVYVPIPGEHFVINSLFAIAVGRQLDMSVEECIDGIRETTLTKNRMDTLRLKDGITVIDGTYNASEDSMKSSIDVLKNYSGRKICVLADMLEMGKFSKQLHQAVGNYVAKEAIDVAIFVGNDAKYMYQEAKKNDAVMVSYFDNKIDAWQYLESMIQSNDTILLKGSNSMGLKELVDKLKEKYV